MNKLDKMISYLQARETEICEDMIEVLTAARTMRESVSVVRIVGKTVVEVRDEAAFISAAKDFSELTGIWNSPPAEDP